MSKVYFAINCQSRVVDGVTILEFPTKEPSKIAESIDSLKNHMKLTFKYLDHDLIDEVVKEMITKNQIGLITKALVSVDEPDDSVGYAKRLRAEVSEAYYKAFAKK